MANEADRVLLDVRLSGGDVAPGAPPPASSSSPTSPTSQLENPLTPVTDALTSLSESIKRAANVSVTNTDAATAPTPSAALAPDTAAASPPSISDTVLAPAPTPVAETTTAQPPSPATLVGPHTSVQPVVATVIPEPVFAPGNADPTAIPPIFQPPADMPEAPVFAESVDEPTFTDTVGNLLRGAGPALPAFAGSIAAQATGSATLGGVVGTAAGAAFGEGGPLASLAGPAGIGLAVGVIASEIVTKLTDTFDKVLQTGTQALTSSTRADPLQAGLGAASSAAGLADPLELLTGLNLNPLDDIVQSLIGSVSTVVSNLDNLGSSLGEYSGEIATATAQAEIAAIEGSIGRAQQLGPELSAFIRERSEATQAFEELKTAFIRQLLPLMVTLAREVTDFTKLTTATINALKELGAGDFISDFLASFINGNPKLAAANALIQFMLSRWSKLVQKQLDALDNQDPEIQAEIARFLDPAGFAGAAGSLPTPPAGFPGIFPPGGGPP